MIVRPSPTRARYLPSTVEQPHQGYRYMKRRRLDRLDRSGDPLRGLSVLFLVGMAFAVGLLVAALASLGLTGLLTGDDMTLVTNAGGSDMQMIVKQGDDITRQMVRTGVPGADAGTLVGQFYRLPDGTLAYVPVGGPTPAPTAAPLPTPTPSATPAATPSAPPMPAPGQTGTPTVPTAPPVDTSGDDYVPPPDSAPATPPSKSKRGEQ